jgi:hypothetical protein
LATADWDTELRLCFHLHPLHAALRAGTLWIWGNLLSL